MKPDDIIKLTQETSADYWNDDAGCYDLDDEESALCGKCGNKTAHEECGGCGIDLCPMCFECGGGFCGCGRAPVWCEARPFVGDE